MLKPVIFCFLIASSLSAYAVVDEKLEAVRSKALEWVDGQTKMLSSARRCIETSADIQGIKICKRGLKDEKSKAGRHGKNDNWFKQKIKKLEGSGN